MATYNNDQAAEQLRESVMAGYFLVPWNELPDCDKVKWQRGAATLRLLFRDESPRSGRTVGTLTIPAQRDPNATMKPKPLRERIAERRVS